MFVYFFFKVIFCHMCLNAIHSGKLSVYGCPSESEIMSGPEFWPGRYLHFIKVLET